MNERRNFIRLASAAVLPVAAAVVSTGVARADDGSVKEFLGAWDTTHTLPIPPFTFREFLTFSDGGVLHETNSFLNTASNLDFSGFGLPSIMNASDGFGNWTRVQKGVADVVFRKMLFNGARENFGDLRATGRVTIENNLLSAEWLVEVVLPTHVVSFGPATSKGKRLA